MKSKLYTRTGDKGTTALVGGTRVPKHSAQVEAYGTIDELKSHIGLIRDMSTDKDLRKNLLDIQNNLFIIESRVASDTEETLAMMPPLPDDALPFLESEIDRMDAALPKLTKFILPGGHPIASQAHIARCICRRAERRVLAFQAQGGELVEKTALRYINRLSDYLFALARLLAHEFGDGDVCWEPDGD